MSGAHSVASGPDLISMPPLTCCTAASCALYVYFIFLPATRAGRIDLQLLKHAVEVYLGLPPSCDITARPRRSSV